MSGSAMRVAVAAWLLIAGRVAATAAEPALEPDAEGRAPRALVTMAPWGHLRRSKVAATAPRRASSHADGDLNRSRFPRCDAPFGRYAFWQVLWEGEVRERWRIRRSTPLPAEAQAARAAFGSYERALVVLCPWGGRS
jgi:hypothetical protein